MAVSVSAMQLAGADAASARVTHDGAVPLPPPSAFIVGTRCTWPGEAATSFVASAPHTLKTRGGTYSATPWRSTTSSRSPALGPCTSTCSLQQQWWAPTAVGVERTSVNVPLRPCTENRCRLPSAVASVSEAPPATSDPPTGTASSGRRPDERGASVSTFHVRHRPTRSTATSTDPPAARKTTGSAAGFSSSSPPPSAVLPSLRSRLPFATSHACTCPVALPV
mmetsp:Transcript_7113/g.22776  ORF Transcript_7113/g.22776 Transcript_7113/m.22776 type:complete len:223 (-) Transcript_7113:2022-2690(-)